MPVEVGIYKRISDDAEGEALGVARQGEDCMALCRLRRWKPIKEYEDNDFSAYQRGVVRPQFEQMLRDLRTGVIQGIVVYDQDRLVRQPKDLERLIDIFEENPHYVCASLQGDIDLSTTDGRTMARVMVAFANKSSADTGRRVARKQLELARGGKPHGGRPPYGWQADGLTADPAAKKEILAAQERIISGARLSEIREDWHRRGIAPLSRRGVRYVSKAKGEGAGAEPLRGHTIRRILTNPALAGVKVYKGEVVRGDDGQPIKAAWDVICDQQRLDAVTAALDERSRPGGAGNSGRGVTRYLLSGIARCGVCGKGLRGSMRKTSTGQRHYYICDNSGAVGGCGKVARIGEPVDELVIALAMADEERRRGVAPEVPEWGQEGRLQTVLTEIKELTAAKVAGHISVSTLLQVLPPLERERDELQLAKRRLLAQAAKASVLDARSQDNFDRLTLSAQRERLLRSVQAVVVHPAGRGKRVFNPDLIEPVWAH